MIDLHCHILPDIDDGPRDWAEALEMAQVARDDGIRTVVATPHLFRHRQVDLQEINAKEIIMQRLEEFRRKLEEAEIPLEILAGCDFPLSPEALALLDQEQVLSVNNTGSYLLLELPGLALPPATEEICYTLCSRGLTPIITHPERHLVIQENPEKLGRLLDLGCLAQLTAGSLTGFFGRRVASLSRTLIKRGYIHLIASDAHRPRGRAPKLSEAAALLAKILGRAAAEAMVTTTPARIIRGEAIL